MIELVVIIALLLFIGIREYFTFKERKELLDRIMARNFTEYKDNVTLEPNEEPKEDPTVEMEQAQEEVMGAEDGTEN